MSEADFCFLDNLRIHNGSHKLIYYFRNIALYDINNAAALINDNRLHYGTLFLLRHEIEQSGLSGFVNLRNRYALIFTREILNEKIEQIKQGYSFSDYIQAAYSSLKWMLETGAPDDGLSDEYDRVLDIASSLLINVYNDRTILPLMADMIFKRHRKGLLIHDLVWVYFECREPYSITLIADYLNSSDRDDVNLAKKLLGISSSEDQDTTRDKMPEYKSYMNWISENTAFFYFSGENFQHTGNPKPFNVAMSGKYLCSAVSPRTGRILRQLTNEEKKLLTEFNGLDYRSQSILADYSLFLFHKDKSQWNKWLRLPLKEQLKQANTGGTP